MWGVFFCYLILSTFQLFSLWGIFFFFSGVNFGNETHCQKLHTEMQQTSDCRQCSLWAWLQLLSVWTTLRLRGRGLLLQRFLIFFFFSANLSYKCALLGLTRLPTPVFLPGEFHGQRSLAGYSSWGHKELDMTEQLTLSRRLGRLWGLLQIKEKFQINSIKLLWKF